MIRRNPIETKINHERWLVSYSDFITLLFAFFVVMYSVSHVNETKYRQLSSTLETAFSSGKASVDRDLPNENAQSDEPNIAELSDLATDLQQVLGDLQNDVVITGNEEWVEIELNANLLFSSGSADLNQDAIQLLNSVADTLSPHDNAVAIAGHTDDVPISNGRFQDNWALSSARAVAVVNLLAFQGVSPERLSAVGYGEYRPVVDNTSPENRARNRRVVLQVARHAVPSSTIELTQSSGDEDAPTQSESTPVPQEPSLQPEPETGLEPVRLQGGGLLFSSDPNLPRSNPPVAIPDVPSASDTEE